MPHQILKTPVAHDVNKYLSIIIMTLLFFITIERRAKTVSFKSEICSSSLVCNSFSAIIVFNICNVHGCSR